MSLFSGPREPSWSYLLMSQNDEPKGELLGVGEARIDLQASSVLGGSGSVSIDDRGQAIDWMNDRIQFVYDPGVDGLDPWPVATMLLTSPKEAHHAEERTSYEAALLTKVSVLEEDAVPATFSIKAGTNILEAVEDVIRSAGESMVSVTPSPAVLPKAMFWDPDTTKRTIVNDLLAAAGYMPVWVDGAGWFRLDPWVAPAERDIAFEFQAGEASVHSPEWNREQDLSSVPNRFLVVGHGTDKVPALVGDARNTDPESPFSYPARGERWIVRSESGVDAASQAEYNTLAQQRLVEAMSPVAQLEVDHEMVPVTVNQLVSFTPSGSTGTKLATVESMSISTSLDAMVKAKWSEVAVIDA